jgi:hypothetical protein
VGGPEKGRSSIAERGAAADRGPTSFLYRPPKWQTGFVPLQAVSFLFGVSLQTRVTKMDRPPQLRTDRLLRRGWLASDRPPFARLNSDPRVMEKLGMTHSASADFDHPLLAEGHPLQRHVLYRLRRPEPA